ncbi:hypothetical protein DY000_02033587 [Brassica cretica]|uniref:RNase H type-1 domain-containing protein n=1 Tax=Brassica cretica TaxID=69181 RepID=A0ABQ7DKC8_BRACR|nr:hypothetical protein DY000_02033587 [Brassica cretica]
MWSLAPTNCSLSQQQTSTLLDRMKAMIKASKRDRKELLSFFVGRRIWKMRNRLLCIGWSLFRKEGTLVTQGSSAILPTETAFQAEAIALCMAVQQLKALSYKRIAFLSDNKQMVNGTNQLSYSGVRAPENCTEAAIIIQDILNLSWGYEFSYHFRPSVGAELKKMCSEYKRWKHVLPALLLISTISAVESLISPVAELVNGWIKLVEGVRFEV